MYNNNQAFEVFGSNRQHAVNDLAEHDVFIVEPDENDDESKTEKSHTTESTHQSVFVHVMKNWQPLVFGPLLAIDRMPAPVWGREKFSSSN